MGSFRKSNCPGQDNMNSKRIADVTMGIVVGILVTSAISVPMIYCSTSSETTRVINGSTYMHELDEETTMVLSPDTIVVGDQTVNGNGYAPIATDLCWITMNVTYLNIFWYDGESSHYGGITGANVALNPAEKTISITDITPTAGSPITETSLDLTYNDFCFIRDVKGDYTCTTLANISELMINSINDVYAVGAYSGINAVSNNIVKINGTSQAGDAFTVTTTSDPDLIKFSMNTTEALSYIIVPASVWGESAVSDDMLKLLDAIPLIMTCVLIIGVTSIIVSRRE